ncbi:MAG: hypothetical protein AB7G21_10895, partial [Dehalococcoidia bacterium]
MPKQNTRERAWEAIEPFVAEWRARTKDDNAAFRDWAVQQVLWDEELSTDEVQRATAVDGKDDLGIDAWHLATESTPNVLYLVQSKNTKAVVADLDKLLGGLHDLFHETASIRANEELKLRADEFQQSAADPFRVEFHVVSSEIVTASVRTHAARLSEKPINLFERDVECSFMIHDVADLSESLRVSDSTSTDVTFEIDRNQLFQFSTALDVHT